MHVHEEAASGKSDGTMFLLTNCMLCDAASPHWLKVLEPAPCMSHTFGKDVPASVCDDRALVNIAMDKLITGGVIDAAGLFRCKWDDVALLPSF